MALDKVAHIINDIKAGNPAAIYFLFGEEPYYIDAISDYIEEHVLTEDQKGFNQTVLYGRDVSVNDIISTAKRYPMMAERQVVIVKEAQDLSRNLEKILPYVENPQPTTVLVFCYKYKKLDKRLKLYKALSKKGVLFESKKLYENQIPDWIRRVLATKGYTITPKAAQMLVEFLGTDLGKIHNELNKLQLVSPPGSQFTPELIEENIGFSKDFNNFELQHALGTKNTAKAFRIIQHFSENPKNHPITMTVALLFSFYSKILKYHALTNKSEAPKVLGVSPYFMKDYETAARNYSMKKTSAIIAKIRDIDVKSKGVGASNLSQGDLLKELLTTIIS